MSVRLRLDTVRSAVAVSRAHRVVEAPGKATSTFESTPLAERLPKVRRLSVERQLRAPLAHLKDTRCCKGRNARPDNIFSRRRSLGGKTHNEDDDKSPQSGGARSRVRVASLRAGHFSHA